MSPVTGDTLEVPVESVSNMTVANTDTYGYVLVIDNLDKNECEVLLPEGRQNNPIDVCMLYQYIRIRRWVT